MSGIRVSTSNLNNNQSDRNYFSEPVPSSPITRPNIEQEPDYNNNFNEVWTPENEEIVNSWLDLLKYNNLINYFYFFKVKRIEGRWAWLLIVLSALSSSISLFQFQEENKELETTAKILLGIFTLMTTLIAAWMKKQNYIEKVSELDKYILKTSKIIGALEADLELPLENRIEFTDFMKKYKELIVEFNSITPLISPDDWKETVYEITKFYPEIAYDYYPWKLSDNFGQSIIDTYRYIKYNSFMKRLLRCFYCQSKCCMTKYDSSVLEKNIKNIYKNKILKGDIKHNSDIKKKEGISLLANTNNIKLKLPPILNSGSSGSRLSTPEHYVKKHKSGNTRAYVL